MSTQRQVILWRLFAYLTIVGLLAFLAMMQTANAQTVTAEANVSWTLPTTDTLGQPLTGENALRQVKLYVSTSPITDDTTLQPIELPPGATTYTYEQAVPNVPTGVTVTLQVNLAITEP